MPGGGSMPGVLIVLRIRLGFGLIGLALPAQLAGLPQYTQHLNAT